MDIGTKPIPPGYVVRGGNELSKKLVALKKMYNNIPFEYMTDKQKEEARVDFDNLFLEVVDPESVTLTAAEARARALSTELRMIKLKIAVNITKMEIDWDFSIERIAEEIVQKLREDGYVVTRPGVETNTYKIKW